MKSAKELLDEIAEKYSLNNSEIARRVGSTQATISRIRNGDVENCQSGLYIEICKLRDLLKRKAA